MQLQSFSTSNIYVPDGYTFGLNQVPFNSELAWRAIEVSGKPEALQPFTFGGKTYHLYKTIDPMELNKITPEVFTYEYRDTDPVEEELGKLFTEAYNDDFTDPDTEAPRQRYGHTVGLLHQKRSLDVGSDRTDWALRASCSFTNQTLLSSCRCASATFLTKDSSTWAESEKPA